MSELFGNRRLNNTEVSTYLFYLNQISRVLVSCLPVKLVESNPTLNNLLSHGFEDDLVKVSEKQYDEHSRY